MKFRLLAFFPPLLLERNNDAQHFCDTFHFKRLCLHNLMKLQKTWGRGANNLFCWCRVKVNSELLHFRSSAFVLIRAESALELAIFILHWKIWLVVLPELYEILKYCWELHLGIKKFQYFPVRMRSYALQTGQDCSQWCIFQDFLQSGVKCLCGFFSRFSQETQLTRYSTQNFLTIFNLHFPFLAHILLLLQYTFLPSKVFNFGFIKYNKTVFNLHHFNEFGCRTWGQPMYHFHTVRS